MELDTKGVPKWYQHRFQNSSKFNAKIVNGKINKVFKVNVFLNGKLFKFIVKAMVFKVSQVAYANGKGIK